MQATCASLLQAAVAAHGGDAGDLQLLDRATGRLQLVASHNLPERTVERWRWVNPFADTTVCARAFRSGKPLFVRDVHADPLFERYLHDAKAAGIRAVHSIPIMVEGR
jgi:GAF domain-containing protein